jgi:hypothetical protein
MPGASPAAALKIILKVRRCARARNPVDDLCMGRMGLLWIVRWKNLWMARQRVFEHSNFPP